MRSWVGPANWPPISLMCPPPIERFSVRPPTRSRASRTTTLRPAAHEGPGRGQAGEPGADDADVGAARAPARGGGRGGGAQGEERRAGGPRSDELAAGESVVHGARA